ncbi:MAG: LapA family protein [Bacteroidales bacterium]|nr:LapA family protein [Bacteroidales bacterium]
MSVKKILYITLLAISFIVLAIFIAENNQAVTIRFMSWEYDSQSGLIVLFSFLAGVFVSVLIWLFSLISRKHPKNKDIKYADQEPMMEEGKKQETIDDMKPEDENKE